MNRFIVCCLCLNAAIWPCSGMLAQASRPNIILILADDAGYADFGFQGSQEFHTPHLDRLAASGIRCEQAYVTAAVCGPSRAGLLTGRYQQRFGFEENNVPGYMSAAGTMGDDMGLPLDQQTIADYLQEIGYRTALIGKWHQGNADRFHPTKRGFDTFYGFRGGARSYHPYGPGNPAPSAERRLEQGMGIYAEADTYLTDALAAAAVDFVQRHQDQPFFLMLSFNAVHTPMMALEGDMAHFPELRGKRRKLAAMALAMDRACGQLIDTLEGLGIRDQTLIIFTNDNGGPSDTNASKNDPLSGTKANHLEGGIRVPFLISWPDALPARQRYAYPISTLDILPTIWAATEADSPAPDSVDGTNLLPFLSGEQKERPHQTLYWKKETRAAIRDGDWKLLRFPDRPAELYYVSADISETHNLALQNPEKVAALYQQLFAWELTLERARWQLLRKYEGKAMKRMDAYRK